MKNMEFNRYIMLRYSLALLFFANLNWLLLLLLAGSKFLLVPFLLTVSAFFPVYEQLKLYSKKQTPLKWTKKYFLVQVIASGVLLPLTLFTPLYNLFFPFMANSVQGSIGIGIILSLGFVIGISCLRKITAIHENKDRAYSNILKYKKALGASD